MAYEIVNSQNDNESLVNQLMSSNDSSEIKKVVDLLNLNMQKQNMARNVALTDIQNKIVSQMAERVEKRPGEFSNRDLLEYLGTVQNILDKSAGVKEELPAVAIQTNNTININTNDTFDDDSKDRIRKALAAVLRSANQKDIIEENGEIINNEQ